MIYTVTTDQSSGLYSFTTINPDNGSIVSSTPIGSSINDNTLQMVGTISSKGVLYQGTVQGLFSVKAQ